MVVTGHFSDFDTLLSFLLLYDISEMFTLLTFAFLTIIVIYYAQFQKAVKFAVCNNQNLLNFILFYFARFPSTANK